MKVLTIFDDVPEEKIFTPKARRLFPKQKNCKKNQHQIKSILNFISQNPQKIYLKNH